VGVDTGTEVTREDAGALPDGTPVERWVLRDGTVTVAVLDHGATLQRIVAPDRDGRAGDVVLGFDDPAAYVEDQPYFGAVIGRYANRIAEGRFPLNGRVYQVARNHHGHHLHGGGRGFDKRAWSGQAVPNGVRLSLTSPDGEEGYPGRLDVTVTYTLVGGDLTLVYTATNTEPDGGLDTIVNLTNHVYFNLAGHGAGSVGEHRVRVPGDRFVPGDADLIPTGDLADVTGTPMDLRAGPTFAAGWDADDEQIRNAGGYDHSWLTVGARPDEPVLAARVVEPVTGRTLEVFTDQPAVHVYSGNMMTHLPGGKGGCSYDHRGGFCLETHHLPDSPNHPAFPSTTLAAGRTFRTTTTFRLGTDRT
jgi:aldose 1-epimerase